jgi:hypothetical protein
MAAIGRLFAAATGSCCRERMPDNVGQARALLGYSVWRCKRFYEGSAMSPSSPLVQDIVLDPSVLSFLVLVTCLAYIYMVFFFDRRLRNSAYLRDSLI